MYMIKIGSLNSIAYDTLEECWKALYPRQRTTYETFCEWMDEGRMFYCNAALCWRRDLNPRIDTDEWRAKEHEANKNRFGYGTRP